MRALFAGGGDPPHFRDIPEPTIDSAVAAIVEPIAVAICDLDVAYIANLLPTEDPYAVGHEFTAASISDNVVDGYSAVASHILPGDTVIVFGSASVGLYAVGAAEALGAPCTYVNDDFARLAVAETLGAHVIDHTPDGRTFGEFPVAIACISTPEGLVSAVRSTEPGGRCHSGGIQFFGADLPWVELYKRGITLSTGRPRARDEMPTVISLVERGVYRISEVCATVVPFDDAPEALSGALPHKTVLAM